MLLGSVFGKFLRDHLRALVGWMIAVTAVTALYSGFWPSIRDTGDLMDAYIDAMPQLTDALGWTDLASPEGYLNATVFGLLTPILMTVAAISLGARAIAGDEEDGGLELVLAHPVSRTRVVLQRFAALAVFVALLGAALFAVLLLLGPILELGVAVERLAAASAAVTLIAFAYGTAALTVGAVTGRRSFAIAAAALLAVVGYLGNSFALQVEELEWLRFLSAFYYGLDPDPLTNGVDAGYTLVLVAVAAVLPVIAVAVFQRRDIMV
ncbi:MAG: ABC transporter permease subunit [Nocardiopsaceae bacterium]|nr:ABC transporter permease subunit [Nocardiopsaceae bacterium]